MWCTKQQWFGGKKYLICSIYLLFPCDVLQKLVSSVTFNNWLLFYPIQGPELRDLWELSSEPHHFLILVLSFNSRNTSYWFVWGTMWQCLNQQIFWIKMNYSMCDCSQMPCFDLFTWDWLCSGTEFPEKIKTRSINVDENYPEWCHSCYGSKTLTFMGFDKQFFQMSCIRVFNFNAKYQFNMTVLFNLYHSSKRKFNCFREHYLNIGENSSVDFNDWHCHWVILKRCPNAFR